MWRGLLLMSCLLAGDCALALAASPADRPRSAVAADSLFRALEPGLELAELPMPPAENGNSGDGGLVALRIDPERFDLRLLNASASEAGEPRSARQWCADSGLVAAINASMFQTDQRTSVSLMQSAEHVNNARLSKDRAVLAFDRADTTVPRADIIDLTCQDFEALRPRYRGLVQSIRMVSCKGENTWSQQPRRTSIAAIAVDSRGRVLFLHCRTPYTTHDFIAALLDLQLDIAKAMYTEGGSQAQVYLRSGEVELERNGKLEGGALIDIQDASAAWPIPNVIGIVRRPVP
ncbi:MAG TPA: phosphodiester glycosidase family protein [Candidatus Udaeobacter sp.]|nr:phosphodiester glycosidase family protein [Candidatus Udaeobacter sp.]